MTTPTRREIRTGIAQFFGGPIMDPTTRIYRTTPLAAQGLAGVRAYFAKRDADSDFTKGLLTGRSMGALMVIHLEHRHGHRYAMGGVTTGVWQSDLTATLHLYHYAQTPHTEDAQADLEDLIEAIVNRIHGDRTLGGICTQAGEGPRGIDDDYDVPYVKAEATESYAWITFDATAFPNA